MVTSKSMDEDDAFIAGQHARNSCSANLLLHDCV
jgi:hypothetical protein